MRRAPSSCSPTAGSSWPGAARPRAPSASRACARRLARHDVRIGRQARDRLRRQRGVRLRRGACSRTAGSWSSATRTPQVAVARLNPNGSLELHLLRRRQEALQLGSDRPRDGRARAAQRQAPRRGLLRARGRQHAGRPPERRRRARHHASARTARRRVDFGATSSASRWRGRPTGGILVAGRSTAGGRGRRAAASQRRARPGLRRRRPRDPARAAAAGDRGAHRSPTAGSSWPATRRRNERDDRHAPAARRLARPAFGTGGTATIDFGALDDLADGAVLQPDGRIVVAGYTQADEDVAVARLDRRRFADAASGPAGKATVDFGAATFGNAVALQPNGRIVVAGQRTGRRRLRRRAPARLTRAGHPRASAANCVNSRPSASGSACRCTSRQPEPSRR